MRIKMFVPHTGFKIPFLFRKAYSNDFGTYYYLFPINLFVRYAQNKKKTK